MLSFELARELRRRGQAAAAAPLRLRPARAAAPGARGADPRPAGAGVHRASSAELNGTPEEVLQHAELMKLLIPVLRADFAVNETYVYTEEEPFDLGISAFGGLGDKEVTARGRRGLEASTPAAVSGCACCRATTSSSTAAKDLILEAVARDLAEILARCRNARDRLSAPLRRSRPGAAAGRDPRLVHPPRSAADRVEPLGRPLSADEWERANRFRFDKHRRQYVVGRGALRTLLAAYPGTRPEQVRFSYGAAGKPFLADPAGDLYFNLSNSDEMALVGFVRGREIGVDIEYLKPMPDCEQIAERFFSESEREVLRALPAERKEEAFFNCWTRKEAYLKAVGDGLAAPLDSFDVTLAPGEPPRMLTLKGDAERAARWYFEHLRPAQDYIGAIAIEGDPPEGGRWRVSTWALVP